MHQAPRPLILGIGGTPRAGSSTERALALSLRAAAEAGADTLLISGPELMLPMYNPGETERSAEAARLVEAFRRCHGVIVASPAYHGTLSGLVKNALDYTEDLRTDERVYFDGLAVGLIVCAGGWQAGGQTLATLRGIAHALRGWPTPLAAMLNTSTRLFDDAGECLDLSSKFQLQAVGQQVVEFARMKIGSRVAVTAPPHAPMAGPDEPTRLSLSRG
ncbi:MAG: NAD(P)H-dependent oxidoreductase [Rhizobiales bacterium]|nr:NAD(P)H-dependent oxidoreductase [Hyphomicrobiales bacterium]